MGVARILGPKMWVPCFAAEQLKGMLAAMVAGWGLGRLGVLNEEHGWYWASAGFAAMVAHRWSPWTGLRTARGSGAVLGVLLGLWPTVTPAVIGSLVVFLGAMVAGVGRWSRPIAAASIPLLVMVWFAAAERFGLYPKAEAGGDGPWPFVVLGAVVAIAGFGGINKPRARPGSGG